MERADNLPVNWDFQNNVIHTLPLISAFANALLWPPRLDNLTRKMALLIQLVYFSGKRLKTNSFLRNSPTHSTCDFLYFFFQNSSEAMIYVYLQIQDFPYGFMHHLGKIC